MSCPYEFRIIDIRDLQRFFIFNRKFETGKNLKGNHHMRKSNLMFHFLFLIVGGMFLLPAFVTASLRVGTAYTNITPPMGVPMAGYYTPRGMTGVHDPLLAKVLIADDAKTRVVLISCDIIHLTKSVTAKTRTMIADELGIPTSNIILHATHSHTGPVISDDYTASLPEKIAECARRAFQTMQPAVLKTGTGFEDKISFNRRFLLRNGSVVFNPGILNPEIVRTAGPIDPEVGILYFETPSGQPIATWVNFALHLDTIGGTEASADYPYFMGEILKRVKDSSMLVMFANGTCGDINHINVMKREQYSSRFGKADQLGSSLAGEVIKQYPNLIGVSEPQLGVRSATIPLAVPEYTPAELEEAKEIAARPFTGGAATPEIRIAMRKLRTMEYLREYAVDAIPAEVQVVSFGSAAIVYLPGEIFVELGKAIKSDSPFPLTFVVELSQDAISYVPTKKAFGEGSYETEVAWIQPGEGERLVETALQILINIKGGEKQR